MTTVAPPEPRVPHVQTCGRVSFHGVSWEGYLQALEIVGDNHVRVTYDDGWMEYEMPSFTHEVISRFLCGLVRAYCLANGIDLITSGSVTLRRKAKLAGLEGDESFYILRFAEMQALRQRRDFDPEIDPPPDLVVEVDLTTDSVTKLPVYGRLGVPEVWRVTPTQLECMVLRGDGAYTQREAGAVLPGFPLGRVMSGIERLNRDGDTAATKWFFSGDAA